MTGYKTLLTLGVGGAILWGIVFYLGPEAKFGANTITASTTPMTVEEAYATLIGDTSLQNLVNNVETKVNQYESNYLLTHTKYWQGISSKYPLLKPDGVDSDWTALNINKIQDLPIEVKIDEYQSPNGLGFVLSIKTEVGGRRFLKLVGGGTQSAVSRDWFYIE